MAGAAVSNQHSRPPLSGEDEAVGGNSKTDMTCVPFRTFLRFLRRPALSAVIMAYSGCWLWLDAARGVDEQVVPYMRLAWMSLSQCFDTVTAETAR